MRNRPALDQYPASQRDLLDRLLAAAPDELPAELVALPDRDLRAVQEMSVLACRLDYPFRHAIGRAVLHRNRGAWPTGERDHD